MIEGFLNWSSPQSREARRAACVDCFSQRMKESVSLFKGEFIAIAKADAYFLGLEDDLIALFDEL